MRQFVKLTDDYETIVIPVDIIRSIHFDDDDVATHFSIILEGQEPNILCSYATPYETKKAFDILCTRLEV